MAEPTLQALMEKTKTTSQRELAAVIGISPSRLSGYKNGGLPQKYIDRANQIATVIAAGSAAIMKIVVTQEEMAEAYGIDQRSISVMKKTNPLKYALIENGVKLQKAISNKNS